MLIEVLIVQFKVLLKGIEKLNKAIKSSYKEQRDKAIFDSLPGAGPKFAPRLLVAFGSDRSRYSDATEIQQYAGIAPVFA